MRRLLHILLLAFLSVAGFAQTETQRIDSLQEVIGLQQGKEKVLTMIELSKAFYDVSFDDCIATGEAAISEAKLLNDNGLLVQAYWKLGVRYMYHSDFDLAHEYLSKAKQMSGTDGDAETMMFILNSLGRVEMFMGEIDSSLLTYQQAMEVSLSIGDELNCADVTNNIAYLYFEQGDVDMAFDHFTAARRWFEQLGDTLSVAQCDNNIGNIYFHWQQYGHAKEIFSRCLPVFEAYGDAYSLSSAYQNLGLVFANGLVNFDSALVCYNKSIEYANMTGDGCMLVDDQIELANLYMKRGDDELALANYRQAMASAEAMNYLDGRLKAYSGLGIYHHKMGDFDASLQYLSRCLQLADENGISLYGNVLRPYLIKDYARMGRFASMEAELDQLTDAYDVSLRELADCKLSGANLQSNAEALLQRSDQAMAQNERLEASMKRYRLAFFGLLGLFVAGLIAIILWKPRR